MKEFEISVYRPSRILFGIVFVGISFTGSLFISLKQDFLFVKILFPLVAILITMLFFYWFSIGKLILGSKNGILHFNWKRKIPFYNIQYESIKISDINAMVLDTGYFLKVIFVNNKKIEINSGKPLKDRSKKFIASIVQQVKKNKGQIIDNEKYRDLKGYNDYTFILVIASIAFTVFFIPRFWNNIEVYTLLSLMLPFIFYFIHLRRRIKKWQQKNKLH
jgi:hypothetical protein